MQPIHSVFGRGLELVFEYKIEEASRPALVLIRVSPTTEIQGPVGAQGKLISLSILELSLKLWLIFLVNYSFLRILETISTFAVLLHRVIHHVSQLSVAKHGVG
jgi:hypothetical protein